jgi:hypothetical protein
MDAERGKFTDPALIRFVANVTSCEHCRTVTWAGVPACSCEFGRRAVDEEQAVEMSEGVAGGRNVSYRAGVDAGNEIS